VKAIATVLAGMCIFLGATLTIAALGYQQSANAVNGIEQLLLSGKTASAISSKKTAKEVRTLLALQAFDHAQTAKQLSLQDQHHAETAVSLSQLDRMISMVSKTVTSQIESYDQTVLIPQLEKTLGH
jgi:hypothetical protein